MHLFHGHWKYPLLDLSATKMFLKPLNKNVRKSSWILKPQFFSGGAKKNEQFFEKLHLPQGGCNLHLRRAGHSSYLEICC